MIYLKHISEPPTLLDIFYFDDMLKLWIIGFRLNISINPFLFKTETVDIKVGLSKVILSHQIERFPAVVGSPAAAWELF